MKIQSFIFLLLLVQLCKTHTYKCAFDQLNQDLRSSSKHNEPEVPLDMPGQYRHGRLLAPSRAPIRIYLDTTAFSGTIISGLNGAPDATRTQLDLLLNSLSIAKQFFQLRLQVGQLLQITVPSYCVDFQPTNQGAVIPNVDLYIIAKYLTDTGIGYGATGKSCDYITGAPLPDSTLQIGRPTVGRIILNTNNLLGGQTTISNRLFQSITSTALHELIHILGFDSTLYTSFLDPNTQNVYSPSIYTVGSPLVNNLRPATNILSTPFVQAWVRIHYDCSTASGMVLQNEDGGGITGGSHWERTATYDQLMTSTSFGATKGLTGLTFALLKDTGWYTVDDSFAETTNYGYKKGCSFLLDACYSSTSFSQFCNSVTEAGKSSCQSTFYGKASCSSDASLMADSCGIYYPFFNCVDDTSVDTGFQPQTKEQYGTNSFCIASNLKTTSLGASDSFLLSRCYPYSCSSDRVIFTIDTFTITCLQTETGIVKTISSLLGSLTCPNFQHYCTVSRKTCPNWCSKNGYCTNGVCNCLSNQFSADCSVSSCSAGQFYDMNAQTCVASGSCPAGTYSNKYSHTCQNCKSPCSSCTVSPNNCLSCISPLLLSNGACLSACPSATYVSSNQCLACDNSVNCLNCLNSATFCTSCLTGLYLNEVAGTCGSTCPGSQPYFDRFNMKCVSVCASYMIFSTPYCDICSGTTFNYLGNCQANCDNIPFFPNSATRACVPCHSSCFRCGGEYAQNCTACTAGSTYLLHQICWTICPKGFYSNPTTAKCQVCPVQLNCLTCKYDAGTTSAFCTSCNYGTFFQQITKICGTSCLTTQFKSTWNNSCASCHVECTTCEGQNNNACLSCTLPALFLSSTNGSYCVSSCPTMGYISDSGSCKNCDSSCLTCGGVAVNQCLTCLTNYYFFDGYCRYICPAGRYPDTTTLLCQLCDGSCSYCFGSGPNKCVHCATSLYLYNFTCTNPCPNGLLPNQWSVCSEHYLLTVLLFYCLIMLVTS